MTAEEIGRNEVCALRCCTLHMMVTTHGALSTLGDSCVLMDKGTTLSLSDCKTKLDGIGFDDSKREKRILIYLELQKKEYGKTSDNFPSSLRSMRDRAPLWASGGH